MTANLPANPDLVMLPDPQGRVQLRPSDHGELLLCRIGQPDAIVAVQPVAAFSLSAPWECISLVDAHGREQAYIQRLDDLPPSQRDPIEAALAWRDFIAEITVIVSVSSFSTPSVWQVETDRGEATLHLQSEDDIRKLDAEGQHLRITAKNGLQFAIPGVADLPKASRKLLARFI